MSQSQVLKDSLLHKVHKHYTKGIIFGPKSSKLIPVVDTPSNPMRLQTFPAIRLDEFSPGARYHGMD